MILALWSSFVIFELSWLIAVGSLCRYPRRLILWVPVGLLFYAASLVGVLRCLLCVCSISCLFGILFWVWCSELQLCGFYLMF